MISLRFKSLVLVILALVMGIMNPLSVSKVEAQSKKYEVRQISAESAYNMDWPNYIVGKWYVNGAFGDFFDTEAEANAYAVALENGTIVRDAIRVATQFDYDCGDLKSESQIGMYKAYYENGKYVTYPTYDEARAVYERREYVKAQSEVIKTQLAGLFGFTYSGKSVYGRERYMDSSEYLDPDNITYDISTGYGLSLIHLTYCDRELFSSAAVFVDDANNNYSDLKKGKDSFGDAKYTKVTAEEIASSEAGKTFIVNAEVIDKWQPGGFYYDGDSHYEKFGPFSTVTEAMQTALVLDYNKQYTGDHILHGYYYEKYGDDLLVNIIYELYCLGYDITQLPGYIG